MSMSTIANRKKLRREAKIVTFLLAAHCCGRVRTWNLHRRQLQGYLTGDSRFQLGTLGDKQRAHAQSHMRSQKPSPKSRNIETAKSSSMHSQHVKRTQSMFEINDHNDSVLVCLGRLGQHSIRAFNHIYVSEKSLGRAALYRLWALKRSRTATDLVRL